MVWIHKPLVYKPWKLSPAAAAFVAEKLRAIDTAANLSAADSRWVTNKHIAGRL